MERTSTITEGESPYRLSTGEPLVSRADFPSPKAEYLAAFEEADQPFLYYYHVEDGRIKTQCLTRGQFLELARRGAACIIHQGLHKGDRVAHCFSDNSPSDLILRLAEALTGAVPVTINWQADNEERILYKITASRAKIIFYDEGFEKKIENMRLALKGNTLLPIRALETFAPAADRDLPPLAYEDEKIIIFTSGTTGLPKGVILPHRSYLANRLTFEDYFRLPPSLPLDLLLVNPLHHTNSSALSDWGIRRRNAVIHLVQRYSSLFWLILAEAAKKKRGIFITSLVPRHFDFLEKLHEEARLPLDKAELEAALSETEILIGSAPVGPTTVNNALKFSNRLPRVRFGSTETCLQVMAIPVTVTQEETMAAFVAGWNHHYQGEKTPGYYIGREHPPFTMVRIVKAVDPGKEGYMHLCEPGEPGYLITRGANLMSGYVTQTGNTASVFREGWYTGLRDLGFALPAENGRSDYYWTGRDSAMLIRGGANYAYEQVAADLSRVLVEDFHLAPEQFRLAIVGLKIESEHEDSCCVTIELQEEALGKREALTRDFLATAARKAPKGCRPDYVRFGEIPRSFKGAVLYPKLKEDFEKHLMLCRT